MAKKIETEEVSTPEETVTLVVKTHLNEAGIHYNPGESITLTPTRAASLGDLVAKAE